MSIVLYVIAGCAYVAANLVLFRMYRAGDTDSILALSFPVGQPGQLKRFLTFAVPMLIFAGSLIAGRSLQ